jgi:hypothetical protein
MANQGVARAKLMNDLPECREQNETVDFSLFFLSFLFHNFIEASLFATLISYPADDAGMFVLCVYLLMPFFVRSLDFFAHTVHIHAKYYYYMEEKLARPDPWTSDMFI